MLYPRETETRELTRDRTPKLAAHALRKRWKK
jgi:hypothetical protein